MAVVIFAFIVLYLLIGAFVSCLASEKYYVENYPLLILLFWPLLIVVELFDEIRELLNDIFTELGERMGRK